MHLCQCFFQSSKHFWNAHFGMAMRSLFDSNYLINYGKMLSFIDLFRKKLHGVKRCKHGGWGRISVLFWVKNHEQIKIYEHHFGTNFVTTGFILAMYNNIAYYQMIDISTLFYNFSNNDLTFWCSLLQNAHRCQHLLEPSVKRIYHL